MFCKNCQKKVEVSNKIIKNKGENFIVSYCYLCNEEIGRKKTMFSQAERIIIIIFGFPTIFFTVLFLTIKTEEHTILSSSVALGLTIAPIVIFYNYKKVRDKKPVLTKNIQAQKENSDSEMQKIYENAVKAFYKKSSLEVSILKAIFGIIFALFVSFFSFYPELLVLLEEQKQYVLQSKQNIILSKAKMIEGSILIYKNTRNKHPKTLSEIDLFNYNLYSLSWDSGKLEKKFFGRLLTEDDFQYSSDGSSYSLCHKSEIIDKCWEN